MAKSFRNYKRNKTKEELKIQLREYIHSAWAKIHILTLASQCDTASIEGPHLVTILSEMNKSLSEFYNLAEYLDVI